MKGLFVEESVSIQAPATKVWEVLTSSRYTSKWVGYFQPLFGSLESEWHLGSHVAWKTLDGITHADGKVTKVNAPQELSFTVHDVSGQFDDVLSDDDGIFYELREVDGGTTLLIRQGDFAKVPDKGEEFHRATMESWKRALPIIKQLAEQ